jgi:hypothetical protein
MLIYMIVAVIVLGAIYSLLINQNRWYTKERELTDVRSTLRAAAEVMSVEIRMASASEGDIVSFDEDSIVLRSVQASGTVCGTNAGGTQLGLMAVSGEFTATSVDSVMAYSLADDTWGLSRVTGVYAGGGGQVETCSWGDTTEAVVEMPSALSGIEVGSEVRAFRRVSYKMIQDGDGRWWLARRSGSTSSYDNMVGPLLAPSDSGLAMYFYDASGASTSDPAQLKQVEILFRAASLGDVRQEDGDMAPQTDSLRTWVVLRG